MISKKSVIYRFLCIRWVLITMAPRNSDMSELCSLRKNEQPFFFSFMYVDQPWDPSFGTKNMPLFLFPRKPREIYAVVSPSPSLFPCEYSGILRTWTDATTASTANARVYWAYPQNTGNTLTVYVLQYPVHQYISTIHIGECWGTSE